MEKKGLLVKTLHKSRARYSLQPFFYDPEKMGDLLEMFSAVIQHMANSMMVNGHDVQEAVKNNIVLYLSAAVDIKRL